MFVPAISKAFSWQLITVLNFLASSPVKDDSNMSITVTIPSVQNIANSTCTPEQSLELKLGKAAIMPNNFNSVSQLHIYTHMIFGIRFCKI